MKKNIDRFQGCYSFLSNYYDAPITVDGIFYPTNEHAFAAAKTKHFEQRKTIANMPTPGKAKRAGRNVSLRNDWEDVKLSIMKELVILKFVNHPGLKQQLLDTGDALLIEGNTWNDTCWGVCNGVGENNLGRILMEVRELLK